MADPGTCLVTGGTGLIGGRLLRVLSARGTPLRALTRDPSRSAGRLPAGVQALGWDGTRPASEALDGVRAVVHLAGEPVFGGRLDERRKRLVRESRIDSTRSLVGAMARRPAGQRPACLVSASAVGYYGSRGEELLGEDAGAGEGYLAEVCRDWEAAAQEAAELGVRVVCLRIGIVLARGGGALARMLPAFRLGLGGRLGDGRQWVPWIHLDDTVALIARALEDPALRDAVNATSPHPVRNADLTRALARELGRPALLRVPAFALRLALGELADELLGSRRALPTRALEAGFRFTHPDLESALAAELH